MSFDGSYPAPPGNKPFSIQDIPINGAYTAITPGTAPAAPTGGIAIAPSLFGLKYIEFAIATGSNDGRYEGVVYQNPTNANQPTQALILQLKVAATGAEASGTIAAKTTIRLMVVGY